MHNNAPPYNLMRHVERDGCVGVIVQKKKGVKCWKLLAVLRYLGMDGGNIDVRDDLILVK